MLMGKEWRVAFGALRALIVLVLVLLVSHAIQELIWLRQTRPLVQIVLKDLLVHMRK